MKLGKIKKIIISFLIIIFFSLSTYAAEKIQITPIINLEELSPTFEEDKDDLEKIQKEDVIFTKKKIDLTKSKKNKIDKIFVNFKALDKITAKTSSIKIPIGEKKVFGALEIKPLKCSFSESQEIRDTVAYVQVKDLFEKSNDQVFVFNGWIFSSSPSLRPIDHPVYDLWLLGCENI